MQLYFYDTDQTMAHRIKRSPHLDSNLIKYILRILDGNPYVRVFIRLGQMQRLDEFKIELNTSISVDQRRYIAPAIEQVAAIWEDGTDEKQKFTRSKIVNIILSIFFTYCTMIKKNLKEQKDCLAHVVRI